LIIWKCPVCKNKLERVHENFVKYGLPKGDNKFWLKCRVCFGDLSSKRRLRYGYAWILVNGFWYYFNGRKWHRLEKNKVKVLLI